MSESFWQNRAWRRRASGTAGLLWTATLLGLVGSAVAARGLGPGPFGALILAEAIAGTVAVFLDVSLEDALMHHGSRRSVAHDYRGLRALLRFAMLVDAIIGVLVFVALAGLAAPIAHLVQENLDPDLVRIAALVMLTRTVDGVTGVALMLEQRPDLRAWSSVIGNTVRGVGVVAVVLADRGAVAVLLAYVAGSAASTVTQATFAWRFGWRRWPDTGADEAVPARAIARFAIHSSIASSVAITREMVAIIIVGNRLGTRGAGIFAVALLPLTGAQVLGSTLRLVLFGEQARLYVRGEIDQLRRSVRWQTMVGAGVGAALALPAALAMPQIIEAIYGGRFDAAVTPARIVLVAAVAVLVVGWSKTLASAMNAPQSRTAMTVLELALLAPALWVLAKSNGVVGAAAGLTIVTVVVSATWLPVAQSLLRRSSGPLPSTVATG